MINLFENKKDCCGCGACANICPRSAISFKNDEYGFAYPEINRSLCIECGMCKRVCAFQNKEKENKPLCAYAACINDSEKIMNSTSGGAFAALAEAVLKGGGIVFGAALEKDKDGFIVRHIDVDSTDNLGKILKSKYVQSKTEKAFLKAKEYLENGKTVLYSGTPCQIAGLKGFLGKEYENLFTADLVCHGVPDITLFRDYIKSIEKRENIKITDFSFRDKNQGWEHLANYTYTAPNGTSATHCINTSSIDYSYLYAFLKKIPLRENCYTCKYAGSNRPADITLGDFWGIEREHPNMLTKNGGKLDSGNGISCVIINTQKGSELFAAASNRFIMYKSTFENAARGNTQLRHPADLPPERQTILNGYKSNRYGCIENLYAKHLSAEKTKAKIKKLVPKKLWNKAKQVIKGT